MYMMPSAKSAESTALRVLCGELEEVHEQNTGIVGTCYDLCVSESKEQPGSAKDAHLAATQGDLFLA